MEAKHTPGPWKITKYTETTISDDNDRTIASTGSYNDGTESTYLENKANAKLITAAPDLLEVLMEAKLQIEYLHGRFSETGTGIALISRIESAIKKASQ